MRPIEQIQAINEQANGPGVWSNDQAQARHDAHCGHKPATDREQAIKGAEKLGKDLSDLLRGL